MSAWSLLGEFDHTPVRPGWEELARRHRFIGKITGYAASGCDGLQGGAKDISILIQGETGSGKEVLARFIHAASNRPGSPFCCKLRRLAENLLESELFGHEKVHLQIPLAVNGIFELADGVRCSSMKLVRLASLYSQVAACSGNGEFMRIGGKVNQDQCQNYRRHKCDSREKS